MTAAPPTPIDVRQCMGWIGCKDAKEQYLSGGPAWLASETRKLHALGVAGIVHHLPLLEQGIIASNGTPSYGFAMAAWLRAQDRDHAAIVNTYGTRMFPLTREGIVIEAYLGSLRLSPELDRLTLAKLDDRFRMIAENLKPITEGGITRIAIDGSVLDAPESRNGRLIAWIESEGLTVRRESNPSIDEPWAFDKPIHVDERTWQARRSMDQYQVQLSGNVQRFVPAPNGDGLSNDQWGVKWNQTAGASIRAMQAQDPLAYSYTPVVEALDLAMKYAPAGTFIGAP